MAGHRQETAPLVCVISGVSTDFGRVVAETFAEEGGRPILLGSVDDRTKLAEVAHKCGCIGAPATVDIHPIDLHDAETIDKFCFNVLSRQGAVDIVVNNPEGNPDTWDRDVEQHIISNFAEVMEERGRLITFIDISHKETAAFERHLKAHKNLRVVVVKKEDFDTGEKIRRVLKEQLKLEDNASGSRTQFGGIVAAEGCRKSTGLLQRKADPEELGKALSDFCGAAMTPCDPHNLEPEEKHEYANEPKRSPDILVQCFKPFNGEPPHDILGNNFLTPPELHYVRNHLPVPDRADVSTYSILIEGDSQFGIRPVQLSLADIMSKLEAVTITATLQCAGNRRNDMCSVELVEGRAPWNCGSISNAEWTGARVQDVLAAAGLDINRLLEKPEGLWLIMEGNDYHRKTQQHYECSIPLEKVLEPRGDVLLAYSMNGGDLPPDHGFPLRVVVPGFVGARMVKWLKRIKVSTTESQSPWQQVDYRPQPKHVKTQAQANPKAAAPLMGLPVQSAILIPEAGSIISAKESSIKVRGYAWSGMGQKIGRVDVSCDGGDTWQQANFTDSVDQPNGRAWAWVLWETHINIPEDKLRRGGKIELLCRAWDVNYNTQPRTIEEIWNFRGLSCNAWHKIPVKVEPRVVEGALTGWVEAGLQKLGIAGA